MGRKWTRVLRVGLWMGKSEIVRVSVRALHSIRLSKSGTNYRLVRLVETYTLYKYNHV